MRERKREGCMILTFIMGFHLKNTAEIIDAHLSVDLWSVTEVREQRERENERERVSNHLDQLMGRIDLPVVWCKYPWLLHQ